MTRAYTVGLGWPSVEESAEFKWNMHNPISKGQRSGVFSVRSLRRLLAPENVLLVVFCGTDEIASIRAQSETSTELACYAQII
jgi:hypothetical protein